MNFEQYEKLTLSDKEFFKKVVSTLYNSTYIIRSVKNDQSLYRFTLKHYSLIDNYLSISGWFLKKDESLGVISLGGPASSRVNLNLDESLSLLVLRIMFEEKKTELSLAPEITIKQIDFQDKFQLLTDRQLKKTRLLLIFRKLQARKLIKVVGDEGDPEAVVILYPSLPFAIDSQTIEESYTTLEQLKSKTKVNDENESIMTDSSVIDGDE